MLVALSVALPARATAKPASAASITLTATAGHKQPAERRVPAQNAADRSTGRAARRAQKSNGGGRVLSVRANDKGYVVRLIKNGDVRIVNVPIE